MSTKNKKRKLTAALTSVSKEGANLDAKKVESDKKVEDQKKVESDDFEKQKDALKRTRLAKEIVELKAELRTAKFELAEIEYKDALQAYEAAKDKDAETKAKKILKDLEKEDPKALKYLIKEVVNQKLSKSLAVRYSDKMHDHLDEILKSTIGADMIRPEEPTEEEDYSDEEEESEDEVEGEDEDDS